MDDFSLKPNCSSTSVLFSFKCRYNLLYIIFLINFEKEVNSEIGRYCKAKDNKAPGGDSCSAVTKFGEAELNKRFIKL